MASKRRAFGWVAAIVIFVVLMIVTPAIPQSQEYHDFADQRTLFLGNVKFSNLIFLGLWHDFSIQFPQGFLIP